MKSRDRQYWDQIVCAEYVEGGYGKYEDAVVKVEQKYPDFREFLAEESREKTAREFAKRLEARFRVADLNEHETPNPTPPHLRAQFLPFKIAVPPMSPSVVTDGARLSSDAATPKQHRRHHGAIKQYHARGVAYRQDAESKWTGMIDDLREQLSGVDHPENLTLAQIVELLNQQKQTRTAGKGQADAAAAAPPI